MKNQPRLLVKTRSSPATRLKILNFAAIGVANTVVDFAIFTIAYKSMSLPLVASNVIAWLIAVSGSYVLNTTITFKSETGKVLRLKDYIAFVASGVLGMVATTTVLMLLSLFIYVMIAKAISILVSFAVNFTMSNLVVFRPRTSHD